MLRRIKTIVKNLFVNNEKRQFYLYEKRYFRHSFVNGKCKTEKQFEASITRFYHTIEKGLAYLNYRPGFGHDIIDILISEMEEYAKCYNTETFFYKTALSTLSFYMKKNKENGFVDKELEQRICSLPGVQNEAGGCFFFNPIKETENISFEDMIKNRHSMRHFSSEPVNLELVKDAINLAQFTPSACNRQGWHTYIVNDREVLKQVLGKH